MGDLNAYHVDVLDNDLVLLADDLHDLALLALVRTTDDFDLRKKKKRKGSVALEIFKSPGKSRKLHARDRRGRCASS
jgi:hypothetical protein